MLRITDRQLEALSRRNHAELMVKIDDWLKDDLPGWTGVPDPQREQQLGVLLDQALSAGMDSEMNYGLFCKLGLLSSDRWESFCARTEVRDVLDCSVRHEGAKIRELYRLAGLV